MQRIGVDIFTFQRKNYLISVDFYSGWFEIDLLNEMSSTTVITKLKVLDRAREVQLNFNQKKCKIWVTEVSYIGHMFTSDGIKPDQRKVEAIVMMPEPSLKQDLQRFIDMDYDIGTTNPKPLMVEEELTTNERVQPRKQIVSRQDNGTENRSLNVYTRSGHLVKRPERLDL